MKKAKEIISLKTVVGYYEDFENNTLGSRELCERDRDYKDNKQWTDAEVKIIEKRKQPVVTINRIKPKIDFLIGMEQQTRTDPKAYPRTPDHDEAADAATEAIRFVCDKNDFDYVASDGFENLLVEGTCACDIYAEEVNGKIEVGLGYYQWDRIFYDIHSRAKDFKDSKYKGVVIWMDKDDAILRFPDREKFITTAFSDSSSDTFDDTPRVTWFDKARDRVRVCLIYVLHKNVWHYSYFTKTGFLTDPIPSPYLDEYGNPDCQLEFQSAYIDRDGNRYGVVRQLISPQDEINKRSSKLLHLINSRQTWGNKTAVPDVAKIKGQLHRPDGHIEIEHGEFGRDFGILPTTDQVAGHFSLLQESKQEIDSVGANAALTGKEDRNMSGRALMARSQSGAMELGPVYDSQRAWKRRIYRQIWNRIKQYWTEERWIRVTDNEDNLKFVGLNAPITAQQAFEQQGIEIPQGIDPNDPRLQSVVGKENLVAEIDVDIIIKEAPDTITLQHEQFEELVRMYQANPQGIPWKTIIQASSLKNKKEILEGGELSEEEQAQQQSQQEMADAHMQLEMGDKQATIDKKQAETVQNETKAEKNHAEALKILHEPIESSAGIENSL